MVLGHALGDAFGPAKLYHFVTPLTSNMAHKTRHEKVRPPRKGGIAFARVIPI